MADVTYFKTRSNHLVTETKENHEVAQWVYNQCQDTFLCVVEILTTTPQFWQKNVDLGDVWTEMYMHIHL
jgi:hypothetical protein